MKEKIEKIKETQSWFLKNISEIDKREPDWLGGGETAIVTTEGKWPVPHPFDTKTTLFSAYDLACGIDFILSYNLLYHRWKSGLSTAWKGISQVTEFQC